MGVSKGIASCFVSKGSLPRAASEDNPLLSASQFRGGFLASERAHERAASGRPASGDVFQNEIPTLQYARISLPRVNTPTVFFVKKSLYDYYYYYDDYYDDYYYYYYYYYYYCCYY